MKNGEIILCNNIKLDMNFENVLSYTESQMVELCRNNKVYSGTKYTMMDPSINEIDIDTPYQNCIYANYVAFNNKSVGNKWYFGFITNVKYINPRTTRISFKLDVFSTWYERFNINKAFIEREHVDDDTVGKHTIPEGLETGDYVTNGIENLSYGSFYYIASISEDLLNNDNTNNNSITTPPTIPLTYHAIPTTETTIAETDTNGDNAYIFTAGSRIDMNLPASIYKDQLTFTVIANAVPDTRTIFDLDFMQEMNTTICRNTPTPVNTAVGDNSIANSLAEITIDPNTQKANKVPSTTLIDERDNQQYTIRKLADGNCWMVQ